MKAMTIGDLKIILGHAIGDDESYGLDGEVDDVKLSELGFDSLAMIDVVGRIEREHRIHIAEAEISGSSTPAEIVDLVNSRRGELEPT